MKTLKYRSVPVTYAGMKFDSKKELERYKQLLLRKRAGEIDNIRRQVRYELIPSQYIDGKCAERAVVYVADFVYDEFLNLPRSVMVGPEDRKRIPVVEDVKSEITRRNKDYVIKRKLMLYKHGIRIREV